MSAEHKLPRLIPVLDVMNGQVVRAVGGRRDEYRPVVSQLTMSSHPVNVALALLERTGANELYVADLDAIRGGTDLSPHVSRLFHEFRTSPVLFWLDIGINSRRPASLLSKFPCVRLVVGIETGASLLDLVNALAVAGSQPVAVSLDLKNGKLLGKWEGWGATHDQDAIGVVRTAISGGAKSLIVLDLARVGTGTGTGTEPLLRAIRAEFPGVDLIAGGGVQTWEDVDRLDEAGATGVLVASALHDGTLKVPRQ